jgi:hypothetical protein
MAGAQHKCGREQFLLTVPEGTAPQVVSFCILDREENANTIESVVGECPPGADRPIQVHNSHDTSPGQQSTDLSSSAKRNLRDLLQGHRLLFKLDLFTPIMQRLYVLIEPDGTLHSTSEAETPAADKCTTYR